MKLMVNYVIQGENLHRFDSEIVEIMQVPPLFSPEPHQTNVKAELIKWVQHKQRNLRVKEKIVVLKTLRV